MRKMMFVNCWTGGIGKRIFSSYIIREQAITKMSMLAKLKEKRTALRQQNLEA